MKRPIATITAIASMLIAPSALPRSKELLVIPTTVAFGGWKISYRLEQKNTSCMAEHRDVAPYLYIQARPDQINVAVSENCTREGYTPAETVRRLNKSTPELIREIDDQLT